LKKLDTQIEANILVKKAWITGTRELNNEALALPALMDASWYRAISGAFFDLVTATWGGSAAAASSYTCANTR